MAEDSQAVESDWPGLDQEPLWSNQLWLEGRGHRGIYMATIYGL